MKTMKNLTNRLMPAIRSNIGWAIVLTAIALLFILFLRVDVSLEDIDKPSVPLRSTDIDPATIKTVIHEKADNMLSPRQWIEDAYNPARDRKIKHATK